MTVTHYTTTGGLFRPFRHGDPLSAKTLNWISIRSWVALALGIVSLVIALR